MTKIGETWQLGWRVTAKCAFGRKDGMKSVRECVYRYNVDMDTLVWTRGKNFPLAYSLRGSNAHAADRMMWRFCSSEPQAAPRCRS